MAAVAQVAWEEVRELDRCPEKFFVHAEKIQQGWTFCDRSSFECRYYDLPSEPDLVVVAEHGLAVAEDEQHQWLELSDLAPDTLKLRARRNRRLVRRVRVRYPKQDTAPPAGPAALDSSAPLPQPA